MSGFGWKLTDNVVTNSYTVKLDASWDSTGGLTGVKSIFTNDTIDKAEVVRKFS